MITLPSKLITFETVAFASFLLTLIMGFVYTFGTYRHDKDKKQAGFILLGTAGIIASLSVMPLIMDNIASQANTLMTATSLFDGFRSIITGKHVPVHMTSSPHLP
jgi:Na+/phosphate symporter